MRLGLILSFVFWVGLAALLSGCSIKAEFGYHGRTGRDDRVQTELVGSERRIAKDRY